MMGLKRISRLVGGLGSQRTAGVATDPRHLMTYHLHAHAPQDHPGAEVRRRHGIVDVRSVVPFANTNQPRTRVLKVSLVCGRVRVAADQKAQDWDLLDFVDMTLAAKRWNTRL